MKNHDDHNCFTNFLLTYIKTFIIFYFNEESFYLFCHFYFHDQMHFSFFLSIALQLLVFLGCLSPKSVHNVSYLH